MGLQGFKELDRQLAALAAVPRGKVLRSAVRAGMKPAADKWKDTIVVGQRPHRTYKGRLVGPGFAKRNIRIITTVSRDKNKAAAIMGARKEAFYEPQFIERGFRGIPGRPSQKAALESTQQAQIDALAAKLKAGILKAARSR